MDLKGRDFLTLKDYTPEEILYLIDLAAELKDKKKKGIVEQPLIGKNVALIFEKTSTRTRCSFEVAAHDLGMGVTYLDPQGSQIGKKESIADTARVLCTMFEGIEYRGFEQTIVEELAKDGISVLDQTKYLKPLMPGPQVFTKKKPTEAQMADVAFGFKAAKAIGAMDLGQTVVVKNQAVMAVEAIEGTDACIRRGGSLARGGAVVVKTAKPSQDTRFDMPAVGLTTLHSMEESDCAVLAIEAWHTLFAEKEAVLAEADRKGIVILAVEQDKI